MHKSHPQNKRSGTRTATIAHSLALLRTLFAERFDRHQLNRIWQTHQRHRRPPVLPFAELLLALIYHVLIGAGSLQDHVAELCGVRLSGSALSQRRQALNWRIFQQILELVLQRRATVAAQPQAFYRGLRLLGLDGTRLALTNTAAILKHFPKAVSRRLQAAFAQVQVAVLVELGLHNPVAVEIGRDGESELALAWRLLERLGAGDLLLADRLYGVQKVAARLLAVVNERGAQFLVRARANLKARLLEPLADGSALVELQTEDAAGVKQQLIVREIQGWVRGRNGARTPVRLWSSLCDAQRYPALELLALYAQRWEVEITIKELKVEMRGGRQNLLLAQTPETAAQEIAALLMAMALLAQVRCTAAQRASVGVLRVSFGQTLRLVRALWTLLEIGAGIHTPKQVRALVARTVDRIAAAVNPPRRRRSCPWAVRQPVGSWPRLLQRRQWQGPVAYEIIPAQPAKS